MEAPPTEAPPTGVAKGPVWVLVVPFTLALITSLRLVWLARPDLVANYPFHFPDSFDWIVNGLFYLQTLTGGAAPVDITIRQPLFPAMIAASYFLHHPEIIVALLSFTTFFSIAAFFRLARVFELSASFTVAGVLIFSFHYPLNFYSYYFMADPFGVALMLWSVVFYAQYDLRPKKALRCILLGALFGAAASLIQLYGLIPAFIFSAALAIRSIRNRAPKTFGLAVVNAVLAASGEAGWMVIKKAMFGSFFATKVTQLGFLQLTLANLSFYAQVWPIYLMPFLIFAVPLLPFVRRIKIPHPLLFPFAYVLSVTAAFTVFVFIYQVQDSRFTTYFIYLAYILLLFLLDRATWRRVPTIHVAAATLLAIYGASAPTDYLDRPTRAVYFDTLASPTSVLQTNRFTRLFDIAPIDRIAGNPCLHTNALTKLTTVDESCRTTPVQMYVNDSLKIYLDYKNR